MQLRGRKFAPVTCYRSYLAEKPKDFEIWVQCGHAEKESGDFDAALHCYLAAHVLRGNDCDLHLQLGHLYTLMDREADAIAAYDKCLEIDGDCADAQRELASLLRAAEGPGFGALSEAPAADFAAPAFEFPIDTLLADDDLLVRIAQEQANGDLFAAALLTRAYVRLAPTDPSRWRALAGALRLVGDESQAGRCEAIAAAIGEEGRRVD